MPHRIDAALFLLGHLLSVKNIFCTDAICPPPPFKYIYAGPAYF